MRDLRCLVHWHHFAHRRSEDGTTGFLECTRCGRYEDIPEGSYSPWLGAG